MKKVSLVATSDLHGDLPDLSSYKADLLCICGDVMPLNIQRKTLESLFWLE